MPALDREALLTALFARLVAKLKKTNGGPVEYMSRRYEDYDKVVAQPALLLVGDDQVPNTAVTGAPPVWVIKAVVVVYAQTHEVDDTPDTQINAIIKGVEEALQRQPNEAPRLGAGHINMHDTNLGGLCSYARIEGTVEVYQGAVSGQAAAIIPIEILAPTGA